jgi:ATP-dependent Zn protease
VVKWFGDEKMIENYQDKIEDLRRIAIHEAGHAVIGRTMAQVCGKVMIISDSDDNSAGWSIIADIYKTMGFWDYPRRWRTQSTLMKGRIVAMMAGAEAEREFFGEGDFGDGEDRRQISMMINDTFGLESNIEIRSREEFLRRWTRFFIRRHRDKFDKVAAALLVKRCLQAVEVNAIIGMTLYDGFEILDAD